MENKKEQLQALYAGFDKLLAEVYAHEEKIPVYGDGNPDARVMLVGEAPGAQETIQRRPFVGAAGKNLDTILELISLDRDSLFVTNVVKFRPCKFSEKTQRFSNRPPTREEVALCAHVLRREIEIIAPAVIVTLGNFALRAVTGDGGIVIGDVHGQFLPCENASYKIYPMYHPAGMIYNPSLKPIFTQDGQNLGENLHLFL